jgi:hypothetical protein
VPFHGVEHCVEHAKGFFGFSGTEGVDAALRQETGSFPRCLEVGLGFLLRAAFLSSLPFGFSLLAFSLKLQVDLLLF